MLVKSVPPNLLLLLIRFGLRVTNKSVLHIASFESRSLRHNFIGTEHALCALARLPDSRLHKFLMRRAADIRTIRHGVMDQDGLGPADRRCRPGILTPRLKKVIAIAADQASQAKHLTAPQSLFVAIVTEGQGVAIRVLKSLGFDTEQLQQEWPETAIPHRVPILRLKPGELVWYVHQTQGAKKPLAFVFSQKGAGYYIFDGQTGTYYNGRDQTWPDKFMEISKLGYEWLGDARSDGIVPDDWEPPEQDARRDGIVARIQNGEL